MIYTSWSRIRSWLKCPRWHKKLYIDKEVEQPINEYLVLGTAVHNVCEFVMDANSFDISSAELYAQINHALVEEVYQFSQETNEELDIDMMMSYIDDVSCLLRNLTDTLKTEIGPFDVRGIETPIISSVDKDKLEYSSEGFSIQGFIDAILEVDDTLYLFDWKISEKGWNEYKLEDLKIVGQLPFYKFLLEKEHRLCYKDIKTVYGVFNRAKQEMEFHYVDIKPQKLLETVDKMIYNAYQESICPPKHFSCMPFCDCKQQGLE